MQNEAAKLVSEAILGVDFKTIIINNKPYTIYPQTIKIICRGLREWAKIGFIIEDQNKLSVISQIPDNCNPILRGLSYFVVGDVRFSRLRALRLYWKWRFGTPAIHSNEMYEAAQVAIQLIDAQAFFDCATSCKNAVKMVATTK